MTPTPQIATQPYEPDIFMHGVFKESGVLCLASDSLTGITFTPEMFGVDTDGQALSTFHELTKHVLSAFYSVIGPQGLAQYSLLKQKKIVCLVRHDLFWRLANPAEIEHDLDHYGEQVIGPSVKEKPELAGQYPVFELEGEKHYFTGPPRMIKAIFNARIKDLEAGEPVTPLTNHLPFEEINGWFAELDSMADSQPPAAGHHKDLQTYFLFVFNNGETEVQIMDKPPIKPDGFQFYGAMKLIDGKLLLLPEGKIEEAIDFTEELQG